MVGIFAALFFCWLVCLTANVLYTAGLPTAKRLEFLGDKLMYWPGWFVAVVIITPLGLTMAFLDSRTQEVGFRETIAQGWSKVRAVAKVSGRKIEKIRLPEEVADEDQGQ